MKKLAKTLSGLALLNLLNPLHAFAESVSCNGGNGLNTAFGCLDITGTGTINTLLSWGVGLAGGFAFLLIVVAAFQITTAQGDAKRVKAGQELLTAALSGLFLVALSVALLNFIGVRILGLTVFGF